MKPKRHQRHFTNAEIQTLRRLWEQWRGSDRFIQRIAAQLERTPEAVRSKALSLGLFCQGNGHGEMTLSQIADALGRSRSTVLHWAKAGALEPMVAAHESRAPYAVSVDALWAWMEDMKTWHLWDVDGLTDLAWREHFATIRDGWLRDTEAAKILNISSDAVTRLYETGKLPGAKVATHAVWFRRDEVVRYSLRRENADTALEQLAHRVARLESLMEKNGLLALGYPVRGQRLGVER